MRKNLFLSAILLTAVVLIFNACKKNSQDKGNQITTTTDNHPATASQVTMMYSMPFNPNAFNKPAKTSDFGDPCANGANTLSYSITKDCNDAANDMVSFNDIVFYATTRPVGKIIVNGTTLSLTYVSTQPAGYYHFQRLNIPASSIGVNVCTTSTMSVQYLACNAPMNTETLSVSNKVGCGNGSIQPGANSPGVGQLSFFVPGAQCTNCPNLYSPNYTFRYRKVGTSTWNSFTVAYPTYYNTTTLSNLSSGSYEVEGANVCSSSSGPFVASTFNPITVN
jgi:hypothetical protein